MLPLVVTIGVVSAAVLIGLALLLLRRLHSLLGAASRLQRDVEPALGTLRSEAEELRERAERLQRAATPPNEGRG